MANGRACAASVLTPQLWLRQDNRYFRTHPAPGPDDVNWKSLRYTASEVGVRKLIALPFLVLLILFPAGFFTGRHGKEKHVPNSFFMHLFFPLLL